MTENEKSDKDKKMVEAGEKLLDILTSPRVIKLSTGKEVTANLYVFSRKEWQELWSRKMKEDVENEMIARAFEIPVEEFIELPFPDTILMADKLKTWGWKPYDEDNSKNSESAS